MSRWKALECEACESEGVLALQPLLLSFTTSRASSVAADEVRGENTG